MDAGFDVFRGGRDRANLIKLACGGLLLLVALIAGSFSVVEPTSYGLRYSKYSGFVDTSYVWGGGRHFVGPGRTFISFPATAQVLECSAAAHANAPPIDARTGRDASDPDSGGQPVKISLSFMYKLRRESVGNLYRQYSVQYTARFLQYARQVVSDVTQRFEPTMFWTQRQHIADEMERALRHVLAQDAEIVSMQLMRTDFAKNFEDSIVNIQLATQARTTNEYLQSVVRVLKEIDIAASQTNATVTAIAAQAEARARVLVSEAVAAGINVTQAAKAEAFADLARALDLSSAQLVRWIKVKALRGHRAQHTAVGLQPPVPVLSAQAP